MEYVSIDKHLSDVLRIQKGLKQADASLLLLMNHVSLEVPRMSGDNEIEWNTSAPGIC
jgi:hypothetical protein